MSSLLNKLLKILGLLLSYLVVMLVFVPAFWLLMKALNRTEVRGRKILQQSRPPFIFAPNHVSMLDDAFIGPIVFIPRALWSYRFIPYHTPERKNFYRGFFFSWLMETSKCVPLTRGKGVYQEGMNRLVELLKGKNVVQIYPEGTRSRSGDIGPGKIGVGRLVRETGVKVVPCYHSGLRQVLPIGHKLPRIGKRVRIFIGEPLSFDDVLHLPNTPQTWQIISDRIIAALRQLRDQMDASDRKTLAS